MSTIDNRVVDMQFNNAAFESKISSTIKSLDDLKKSLDFANSHKSLGDLGSTMKSFNMSSMTSSIEGVSKGFLAMATIGITALTNIANRAVDTGIRMLKGLSLDPIMQGFQEYETNMNSIQTILANTDSKGSTLEDVNAALDQLNQYADQTIYNFSEMARNIGTFTAAGVDLDTSVSAIKGIANLAAISGSNSQQASTAMYQLSQAISTGTVRLMDWNSIVNAGMGGEVFQKALFETGKAMGTIAGVDLTTTFEEWTSGGNSFRSSLEQNWLTAEVLTNTLQGFTGDMTEAQLTALGYTQEQAKEMMRLGELGSAAATEVKTLTQLLGTVKEAVGSGWSSTFRIIFGDFNQAKELFTGLSDAIGGYVSSSADHRNQLLQVWSDLGGRHRTIEALKDAFDGLVEIVTPIKEAFREIFPPIAIQDLLDFTTGLENFAEKLDITRRQSRLLKEGFTGVFAGLEIGITIFKELFNAVKDLAAGFVGDGDGIFQWFADVGNKITALNEVLVDGGGIKRFFEELPELIKTFISSIDLSSLDGLKDSFQALKDFFVGMLDAVDPSALGGITEFFNGLFDSFDRFDPQTTNSMEGGFDRLRDRLGKLWEVLKKIGNGFKWFGERLVALKDFVSGAVSAIFETIGNVITGIGPAIKSALESENLDEVFELLKIALGAGFLKTFSDFQKDGLKIDLTGGLLPSLAETTEKLGGSFEAITNNLNGLTGVLYAMQTKLKADALMKIGIAIGVLAASVLVLSMVQAEDLAKAMGAMSVGFGQLVGSMAVLSAIASGPSGAAKMTLLAGGLILLSGAMLLFSFAVKSFADLDTEEMAQGLGGVAAGLGLLSLAVIPLSANSDGMIRAGLGVMAVAGAMIILAYAVKQFAEMSWEEMGQGLVGVAGGLSLITSAMAFMPEGMLAKGTGLILVGAALLIIAEAMKQFADMEWKEMAKGMAGIGGGLALITGALKLMPKGKTMLASGAGLLMMAGALNLMATAVHLMAMLDWKEIGKGLAGLAGTLILLAAASHAMKGAIRGAIGMSMMSVSLTMLSTALRTFGGMSLEQIGKGLLAIAGSFVIFGLAGYLLSPVVGTLIGLAFALNGFAVAALLFGFAANLVAGAFVIIAKNGKEGVDVVVYALDELVQRLPEMISQLATGLLLAAEEILDAMPELISKVGDIIVAFLQEVQDASPEVAATFVQLVTDALQTIRDIFPDVIATGMEMLLALLQGIRDNMYEITVTVAEIIVEFLNGLADKMPDIIDAGWNLVKAFVGGIIEKAWEVSGGGREAIAEFIKGVGNKSIDVLQAAWNTIADFVSGLVDPIQLFKLITAGGDIALEVIKGIGSKLLDMAQAAKDWVGDLITKLGDAIAGAADRIRDLGRDIANKIAEGLGGILPGLVSDIINSLPNVGDLLPGGGGDLFAPGSTPDGGGAPPPSTFAPTAQSYEERIWPDGSQARVVRSVKNTLEKITEAINDVPDINPVISPVLDLTNVRTEASKLGDILEPTKSLSTTFAYDQASLIAFDNAARETEEFNRSEPEPPREVKFEQNNYSPTALSVGDVYRQTRNLLEFEKEKLVIP